MLDTALYLDVVSGGSAEPGAPPPPERPFVESAPDAPGRLRVAFSTQPPRAAAPPTVSGAVIDAVAETAELLRSLGHELSPQDPDWGGIGPNGAPLPARHPRRRGTVPRPERLEHRTRGMDRMGGLVPQSGSSRLPRGQGAARPHQRSLDGRRARHPGDRRPPPPVGRWQGRGALWTVRGMSGSSPYGFPWNHLGQPALLGAVRDLVPVGLPLSVQLVGRFDDEATLLSLAAQLEAERPWADQTPRRSPELNRRPGGSPRHSHAFVWETLPRPLRRSGQPNTLRIRAISRIDPRGRTRRVRIIFSGFASGLLMRDEVGPARLERQRRVRRFARLGAGRAVVDHQVPGVGVGEAPLVDERRAVGGGRVGDAA